MDELFGIDQDYKPRGLKGSSSSGGGGGSYSYGGSRGNTSNNGGGSGNKMPIWLIILIPVAALVALLTCCLICRKKSGNGNPGSDATFNEAMIKAREKHATNNDANDASPNFETYKGDFEVKYQDRGSKLSGSAKIQLKNNNFGGYKIEGDCSDADGSAAINDGFVSFTGHGWWVEETFTGTDRGLKVLTQGKFDFENNSFTGKWKANTGGSGVYTEFKGKNVTRTFRTDAGVSNPQTLQTMLESDIPMVVALAETPAIEATPVLAHAVPESGFVAEPYVPNNPSPYAEYQTPNQVNGPELYVPRV